MAARTGVDERVEHFVVVGEQVVAVPVKDVRLCVCARVCVCVCDCVEDFCGHSAKCLQNCTVLDPAAHTQTLMSRLSRGM